ncbi:hypothetical protein HRF87_21720 [Bacillus sp. CRN 9]|nr:hypothetical protein [Bacillus sp. CRN 9]
MSEEEKKLLVADLKAEIMKDLTGKDFRVAQDTSKPLAALYAKYKKSLFDKFGPVTYAQVWDSVRKLATYRSGHKYVRDLLPSEEVEAAEFAESLLTQMGIEVSD